MTGTQKENRKLWIIFLIALIIALLPWVLLAQDVEKKKFNLYKEDENAIGYTQAIQVGNTIYISGSVGGGEISKAVKDAYEALSKTLAGYGATFKNVVKENVFTTDIEAFKTQEGLRRSYYNNDFPAATWVQVERLYLPEFSVEIELIAVLPD